MRVDGTADAAPRATYRADLTLNPAQGDEIVTQLGAVNVRASNRGRGAEAELLVQRLRERGVLSAENRTNVKVGVYESDTGQMRVDASRGCIEIVTPRSEGATLTPAQPSVALPTLSATADKTPLAVFLSSLDGKELPASGRLLLIVVSDAVNRGMSFSDERRQVLQSVGTLPVLARVVHVEVSLKHRRAGSLRMWAIAPNGTRREEIPLQVKDNRAIAQIDTARLAAGPTPYFEIAAR